MAHLVQSIYLSAGSPRFRECKASLSFAKVFRYGESPKRVRHFSWVPLPTPSTLRLLRFHLISAYRPERKKREGGREPINSWDPPHPRSHQTTVKAGEDEVEATTTAVPVTDPAVMVQVPENVHTVYLGSTV